MQSCTAITHTVPHCGLRHYLLEQSLDPNPWLDSTPPLYRTQSPTQCTTIVQCTTVNPPLGWYSETVWIPDANAQTIIRDSSSNDKFSFLSWIMIAKCDGIFLRLSASLCILSSLVSLLLITYAIPFQIHSMVNNRQLFIHADQCNALSVNLHAPS